MDRIIGIVTMLALALGLDAGSAPKFTDVGEPQTFRVSSRADGDIQAPYQSDDLQAPLRDV